MEPKDVKINAAMTQLQALLKKQDQLAAALKATMAQVETKKAEIAKLLGPSTEVA